MSELPFTLQLLHGLTDSLKQITPDNGFRFDMSDFADGDGVTMSRVFRGRLWFGDSDPVPMLSVLEGQSPEDPLVEAPTPEGPFAEINWPLIVQGFVADDIANPTDPARLLLTDVQQRLAYEAARKTSGLTPNCDAFGLGNSAAGKIIKLWFDPIGICRPADELSSRAYFWLRVIATIIVRPTLPYA